MRPNRRSLCTSRACSRETQPEPQSSSPKCKAGPSAPGAPTAKLQSAVLQALTEGNQRILVSMLEAGEWTVEGNELVIKVAESQTVVDMSLGGEARRLAVASASGVLGRAVKLKIIPGATVAATEKAQRRSQNRTGRSAALVAGAVPSRIRSSGGCKRNLARRFAP